MTGILELKSEGFVGQCRNLTNVFNMAFVEKYTSKAKQ